MRFVCAARRLAALMLLAAALAPGSLLQAATPTAANAAGPLERFLTGLRTLQTDFTQTVTNPQGEIVERGGGSLLVERPGRFRWEYQPSGQGSQLLISDGRNLWFYDRELSQVTVRPLTAGLAATPILLLSGSLTELRAAFDFMDAGRRDGLQWVAVHPHDPQAGFRDAQLGFKGEQLRRMIFHDMLGQTLRLDFSHDRRNAPVNEAQFQFQAPAGVDVIGTPQP